MNFDAVTAAAVRDEIQTQLVGGRVERVLLPAELAIALEVYAHGAKRWLFASAHPQQGRVHVASEKLARASDDVSPLLLLMRKYVRDGRLVAVEQPAWERILSLRFEKRDDEGVLVSSRLIIEVMGRHSNIVLVSEDGRVLDSIKRVNAGMSRVRIVLPNHPYALPPPQDRLAPTALGPSELARVASGAAPGASLWQTLVGALAGFSPLLAREVAFRATGDANAKVGGVSWAAVAQVIHDIIDNVVAGRWAPCLGLLQGEPAAYAAFELRQYAERRAVGSISEAIETYYAAGATPGVQPTRAGETGKTALRQTIASLRERAQRRQRALEESLPKLTEVERLRTSGELLLGFAHEIAPGSTRAVLDGRQIDLDPALSPVDNAQRYFREYHKAKAGLEEVPVLLEQANAELAFIAQAATDLALASSPAEVAEVGNELAAAGLIKSEAAGKRKRRDRALPLGRPVTSADGFDILIGHSARQNERVTFELGAGGDVWLHARGVPGAHVLVKARGREVPERTLREAAAYAAYYSQSRDSTTVAVDYTLQRHVRRTKGGPPGLVTYVGEKTLHVRAAPPPKQR